MKEKFIVFEGIDGSGKSTQFKLFCNKLKEKGYNVWETFEPTRGPIGNLIRERFHSLSDGLIYTLLFYADRIEHNFNIQEKLKQGFTVVSDRYYHSTLAYQAAQGLDMEFLVGFHRLLRSSGKIQKPDLVFFIDVPAEEAMKRINARPKEKVKIFERLEFLKKLRKNYLKLQELLNENIFVIDGTGTIEEVHKRVCSAVHL